VKKVLLSWIGNNDLKSVNTGERSKGMLIAFLNSEYFSDIDECHLLFNKNTEAAREKTKYLKHIKDLFSNDKTLVVHEFDLAPDSFRQIYKNANDIIEKIKAESHGKVNLFYHLSSGTGQTAAIWTVISRTKHPGVLYMTYLDGKSKALKTKIAEIPFDIDESYIQYLEKNNDLEIFKMWSDIPEYESIIHKSETMRLLLNKAFKIAPHDIPALILGETGTGKELFARAVHKSSKRADKPFITINCSAIQETTANATLFGWSKGAWTGSVDQGKGYFVECDGGTLFLDEIGDLSLETQTKLLRVLQFGEVQRVGDGRTFQSDVRIIAATNKDLRQMVIDGKFREDLFYRINVAVLKIPPLRDRGSDSLIIAEHFLDEINQKFKIDGEKYITAAFSNSAKNFIVNYGWPGNIRELYHTIQRACIWNENKLITEEDIKTHLLEPLHNECEKKIELSAGNPVNLEEIVGQLKQKYIVAALKLTNNNKTEASKLLGYKSYQTMTNAMKKVGIAIN